MVLKDSFYPLEISSCGRSFLLFGRLLSMRYLPRQFISLSNSQYSQINLSTPNHFVFQKRHQILGMILSLLSVSPTLHFVCWSFACCFLVELGDSTK